MDKKNEHITNQKNIVEYKKMGRSSSKLKALIKKNIIVLKRNKCTTLCEILYPIIIMVILLAIRKAFSIDDKQERIKKGELKLEIKWNNAFIEFVEARLNLERSIEIKEEQFLNMLDIKETLLV